MARRRATATSVVAVTALILGSAVAGCASAPPLHLSAPTTVRVGDQRGVRVSAARPGRPVVLDASVTHQARTWTSRATFTADSSGHVDTAQQAPTSGSYTGVVANGLLATMARGGDNSGYLSDGREAVTYQASQDGRALGEIHQTRDLLADSTERELTVADDGLAATMLTPKATKPGATAVLVLGGSEGGEPVLQAAALAEQGHPALAAAYFGEPGLPRTLQDIPVERVGKALAYLAAQPGIDPSRIAVTGASRGSELALLTALHYPHRVAGVVVLSPSNLVHPGLPSGNAFTWRGRPVHQGLIPVRRITVPILLVCGTDDQLSQACPASRAIAAAPHRATRQVVRAKGAGHFVDGLVPDLPEPVGSQDGANGPEAIGGTVSADGLGRVRAWAAALRWLDQLPPLS